jgi:hypothetical protein
MDYNPQLAHEMKFSHEENLAYQLCSYYLKCRSKYFPNYRHGKTIRDVAKLKKSVMFKHMIKFIKDNQKRFDEFQMILFIRSQFEIMRKIQDDGNQPLIEVNMLHGEQANKRWELWKKWVKEKTNVSQINYVFVESNLVYEFEKTRKTIVGMLEDNLNLDNYISKGSSILKFVLLKKISPIYIMCSAWVQKLPKQILNDLNDLCNLENLQDFSLDSAKTLYRKYFDFEINK